MPKIEFVEPMSGYRLKIALDNGNMLILDLSRKLDTTRFRQLKQAGLFDRALWDGERVYWDELTEISVGELMGLALWEGRSRAGGRENAKPRPDGQDFRPPPVAKRKTAQPRRPESPDPTACSNETEASL